MNVPERIGEFRVEELIGRGGVGSVFRAFDEKLRRTVAIKIINAPELDETWSARFLIEARALATLNHPSIVQIYQVGTDPAYIVMEHVEGRTLAKIIRHGGLPVERAVPFLRQIAEALAVAHRQGVIHGDIKPSNIMLTPTGLIKLLDFGLAKLQPTAEETAEVLVAGTPAYMSPELVQGAAVDTRSDLFSLGVIAYEVLTGELPFRGSLFQILGRITSEKHASASTVRPSIPGELSDLIDRMLVKDRKRRTQTADEVVAEFSKIEASYPQEAVESSQPGTQPFVERFRVALRRYKAEVKASSPDPDDAIENVRRSLRHLIEARHGA
jgi:serine/threonine protein kinase